MGDAEPIIDESQSRYRVRFTRARGFAALFERPDNTFQWSGYGTLRVERGGVEFEATRRGPMGLARPEAHFVPGREISNVYREADGVRVEFREGTQQTFLNFWAEDSAAAASIVEQLPTARTVEVEDAPRAASKPPRQFRIALAGPIILSLLAIAMSVWFGQRWMNRDTAPVSGALARPAAAVTVAPVKAQPAPLSPEESQALQVELARFAARSGALQSQFKSAFDALQDGTLSQANFADGLERWLIPQWESEEAGLRKTTFPPGSRREALRTLQIGITRNWRSGLETYAAGLRRQETPMVYRAFAYIAAAEEAERGERELTAP